MPRAMNRGWRTFRAHDREEISIMGGPWLCEHRATALVCDILGHSLVGCHAAWETLRSLPEESACKLSRELHQRHFAAENSEGK